MPVKLLLLLQGGSVMTEIRTYLLSVSISAIFVCLVTSIIPEGRVKKAASYIGNMLLLLTVLSPVVRLDEQIVQSAVSRIERQMQTVQMHTSSDPSQRMNALIKERCETYILDKAMDLGMAIEVSVTTQTDQVCPQPNGAAIVGDYSLMQQERLAEILEEDLGIPREEQQWKEK